MFRSILKALISHNPNHSALRNVRFIQTQSASIKPKLPFQDKQSPTVSYLIDSCGLSLKSAIEASKLVEIRNKERSDSVLELLRSHGLSKTDISKLISKCPPVILADPVNNLRPRLEFFESLGIARPDLPRTVIKSSKLFNRSLDKGIKPTLDILKCYADPNKNVAQTLFMLSILVSVSLEKVLLNVETLRHHNVPKAYIGDMLLRYPRSVTGRADNFKEVVTAVSEIGINPKRQKFIAAVAVTVFYKSTWERRKEAFLSLGWTESDFDLAFSLHPAVMFNTEKKVRKMIDFLVNKVGLKASDVARCPAVLQVSLEKRVIPRWSVLQILISKGLLKKKSGFISRFLASKKAFEDSTVHKFKDKVPELVKAYESRISSGELSKATSKDAKKGVY